MKVKMTGRQWKRYGQIVSKELNGEPTNKEEKKVVIKGNIRLFLEVHRSEPSKKYQRLFSLNLPRQSERRIE